MHKYSSKELADLRKFRRSALGIKFFEDLRESIPSADQAPTSNPESKSTFLDTMRGYELLLKRAEAIINQTQQEEKNEPTDKRDIQQRWTKQRTVDTDD